MPALTLANLAAYALQVAAVVAIGAGLPILLRLASPKARLMYWRSLLLACLLLPLVQPLTPPAIEAPPAAGAAVVSGAAVAVQEQDALPTLGWLMGRVIGVVLILGIAARLVWLGLGAITLRRLRRLAPPLWPRPVAVDEASELVGADAEFRITSEVTHPVTFGETRPVVVVPEQFRSFAGSQQKAVACHELVHVRRHDWLRTAADELIRSALWFHPAFWWLFDQIRLTREQVVDREVVRLLGNRQPYLEALLRLAVPVRRPALRPAPLFLTHAHLPQRIALLVKEVHMSRSRLVSSLLAMAVVLLFGGRLAVGAFPLHASATPFDGGQAAQQTKPGQPAQQAKPGQTAPEQQASRPGEPTKSSKPALPPPKKIYDVKPVYPPEAKAKGISGIVILEATMNAAGTVTAVKAIKGHELLVPAAIDAVRQWRFEPQPGMPKRIMTVTVNFRLDSGAKDKGVKGGVPGGVGGGVPGGVAGGVQGGVPGGVEGAKEVGVDVDAAKQAEASFPPDAVKVGRGIEPPRKIVDVKPVYPEEAQKAKVQGTIIIELLLGKDGKVQDARVLRSIPELDQAALDAVRQWEFEPVLVNGHPERAIMTVTLRFVLE
jgi:TonB family protein